MFSDLSHSRCNRPKSRLQKKINRLFSWRQNCVLTNLKYSGHATFELSTHEAITCSPEGNIRATSPNTQLLPSTRHKLKGLKQRDTKVMGHGKEKKEMHTGDKMLATVKNRRWEQLSTHQYNMQSQIYSVLPNVQFSMQRCSVFAKNKQAF